LHGGAGADSFVFNTLPGTDNIDMIADFDVLLDEIVAHGVPLSIVDPTSGLRRMHPLVRGVLTAELNLTRAAEIAELRVRAAEVELALGARTRAVSHLIAADEFEWAFDLAFTSVGEVYRTGHLCSMGAWIDEFPPEFVAGSPDRSSAYALALAYLGRRDEAERWTRIASDHIDGGPNSIDVASTRARVVAAIDRGDTDTVRAEVAALRLRLGADEIDRDRDSQLHTAMAIASLVDERLDDAAYWVRSLVRWPDMAERLRALGHPTRAAWEAFLRGSLEESTDLAEGLLDEVGASSGAAPPVVAELYSLLAHLALERVDLEQAAHWSSSALQRLNGRRSCLHRFIIDRVAVAVTEATSGIEAAIRELRSAGEGAPPTLAVRYELLLAEFEARGGLRRSATQRLAVLPPSPRKSLALARLALLADRPEIVRDTVEHLVDLPVALQIEAALMSALAAPGSRELERAIAIGAEQGYVWTYRREGSEIGRMLRDAMAADPRWSATRLAAALSSDSPDPVFIVAALTDAERRVLAFLPSHRSLPEIAAEMCLSVNTVKTHVRSIYTKLRVGSRSEAVERASETGLLATSPRM
ncbi:MAG: hypothetical protein FGM58_11230, partial [Acidimicrobiia bacterium]|nr:hypothetical protein [Acidimicrobiia bacterium]